MDRKEWLSRVQKKLVDMAPDPILMDEALAAARPIFEAAIAGRVDLGISDGIIAADPLPAVNGLFRCRAGRTLTVSIAARLIPAMWMNEAAEAAMAVGFSEAVAASVSQPIWTMLSPADSPVWETEENRRFAGGLWRAMGRDLEMAYVQCAGAALGRQLAQGCWGLLCWLFGQACWNNRPAVERLARLAPFLTRYYPVGAKTDEPDTWLFLAA